MKKKVNDHRKRKWLKPINWNGYLIVVILTVSITILLPGLLAVGQPVVHSTLGKRANQVLILAQQETKAPQPEEIKKQTETEPSNQQELQQKQKESATGEKPPQEQRESATGEKPPQEQRESATGEKPPQEQEVSLEEEKKSLGKEINESYEEWEAERTSSQTWHSASAIATIFITTGITLLGAGLFELPNKKLIIFILGIIAVFIQFNVNIFLLEKSIGGYKILEEQGSFLKSKVESVRTNNELSEVREQFQDLVLESKKLE
ncbi:MAG: MFS transporter [Scytonema sp. RU_4_4]|nr:MFS transporter [Scytonema sp. RU_4_4]